jgi:hypothetical protein
MADEKKTLQPLGDVFKPIMDVAKSIDSVLLDLSVATSVARRRIEPFVRVAEAMKRFHDLSFALVKVPYEILSLVEILINDILEGSLLSEKGLLGEKSAREEGGKGGS